MRKREGRLTLVGLLALILVQGQVACGNTASPTDCGLGGAAVHTEIKWTLTFACDLEPRGRYYNRDIFSVGFEGRPSRRLTSGYAQDLDPTWHPSGEGLAFSSTRDGRLNVYWMGGDGHAVRRVTSALAQEFEPSWSPDGELIIFASGRDGARGPLGPRGLPASLYTVHLDGTGLVRLTHTPAYDGDPSWAPDGSEILFVSDRAGTSDLWIMSPDGSGQHRLTTSADADDRPVWSPDSSQIAFSRGREGSNESAIFVMDADGSRQHRLIAGEGREPSWSPDGRWIAFVSNRDGHSNLFVASVDGSQIFQLTHDQAPKFRPGWRPK
jgi:Tol biopolymer transport system component